MPALPPAYRSIKQKLSVRLGQQWLPGMRLPPIKDLAQELGAGQVNTHRAVKELTEEGLLVSRPRVGTFVAHVLNPAKLALASASASAGAGSQVRGGVLAGKSIHVTYEGTEMSDMVQRMYDACAKRLIQYGAVVGLGRQKWTQPLEDATQRADGVIAINPSSGRAVRCRSDQSLLVLSTTAQVNVDMPGGFDIVTVDEQRGGYLAGWALREAGVKDPCFIGASKTEEGEEYGPTSRDRLEGFEQVFGTLAADRRIVVGYYDYHNGAAAVPKYRRLGSKPDAIFAASDELAVGFIYGMTALEQVAGKDFTIIGFDAQRMARRLKPFALTSVEVPIEALADRGAELLTERLLRPAQAPRTLRVGCDLFHGGTVPGLPGSSFEQDGESP